MFTGIITDLGRLKSLTPRGDTRFVVSTSYDTASINQGASIACDGVCLTVVEKGPDWFAVDVSEATIACTTFGELQPGDSINLERSLKVGDELGGHIVTGHVDAVGLVREVTPVGDSACLSIEVPQSISQFISAKGAVTVNGASLTVNEIAGNTISINVIPHTRQKTNLGRLIAGKTVNIEVDVLARYLARLVAAEHS
jgi:riboflavin synthase